MITFDADEFCLALVYLTEFERRLELLTDRERPLPTNDASHGAGIIGIALRDYQKARTTFEKLLKKPDYAFAAEVSDFLKMIEERTRVAERP
jgi:hypothetical protein